MRRQILSAQLQPESCQDLEMPASAMALSVELVGNMPTIYLLADMDEPLVTREALMLMEYAVLPPDVHIDEYVGSVSMAGGSTVLHIFLKKDESSL